MATPSITLDAQMGAVLLYACLRDCDELGLRAGVDFVAVIPGGAVPLVRLTPLPDDALQSLIVLGITSPAPLADPLAGSNGQADGPAPTPRLPGPRLVP